MYHDDRERARNLARLRRPKNYPTLPEQLPPFAPPDLLPLATSLANSLRQLLQLIRELPMPEDSRTELADLRATIALDIDHYRDIRTTQGLQTATREIGRLLRP